MRRTLTAALAIAGLAVIPLAAGAAPVPKTLSLSANHGTIVFGRSVALSGHYTASNAGGRSVALQVDAFPFDGSWTNVANATTNAQGNFGFVRTPPVNSRFRARQGSTFSAPLTVLVRIRTSLGLSDRTPAVGQRVRFAGRACPEHDGALVRIERRTSTGGWRTVARTTLRDIPGSTCSRYSRRLRVFHSRTFRTVVVSPHGDHQNGISGRHRARVH
jgi:hypothetical protein